jgi:predicted amidohydrolase
VRLACLQFQPEFGRISRNLEMIGRLLQGRSADLVVLPELCTSGYTFADRAELRALAEEVPSGPGVRELIRLSAASGMTICAGLAERSGKRLFNSAVLVGPNGLVGLYRKIHLFDRENTLFDPGDLGFPIFECAGIRVGMMICFDWRYPESARTLALKGADLIAHPANLVMPHCQDAMRIRCLENHVLAATANRIGTENRAGFAYSFTGRSQITGFFGEPLVRAGHGVEAWIEAEVDPERARLRGLGPIPDILRHRRPEAYIR